MPPRAATGTLAAYMVKEALEIQEVGETTRPARAGALKAFETAYIAPVSDAIKAKDFDKFDAAFKAGAKGCNGCHASSGFPLHRVRASGVAPAPLNFARRNELRDGRRGRRTFCRAPLGLLRAGAWLRRRWREPTSAGAFDLE